MATENERPPWWGNKLRSGVARGWITGDLAEKYHFVCAKLGGERAFSEVMHGRRRYFLFEQLLLLLELSDELGFSNEHQNH